MFLLFTPSYMICIIYTRTVKTLTGDTRKIFVIHIAMCLRVLRSRATASERAMVRATIAVEQCYFDQASCGYWHV